MHSRIRTLGFARSQILTRNRCRRSHQTNRRPRNEREELVVRNCKRPLSRGTLRQRSDERKHEHTADVHRNSLDACRKSKLEDLPDDGPVWSITAAARNRYHPRAGPQSRDCVNGDQSRRDAHSHRSACRTKSGNWTKPADQYNVQNEIEHCHRDAEQHRRTRVTCGTQSTAQHEEHHQAAAEYKHDAQERQCFGFHFRRRMHEVE